MTRTFSDPKPPLRSSHLASGANNQITLLEYSDHKAVLKQTRPGGTNHLAHESHILRHLPDRIGPAVLHETPDPRTGALDSLTLEHIQGEHKYDLTEPDAALLGRTLRALHATDLPPLRPTLESPSWEAFFQDRLMAQFLDAKDAAPASQVREMEQTLEAIRTLGMAMGSKLGDEGRTLVHTDIIPLNVIFQEDRCRVIDWELARIDFPEWDLCSTLKAFAFSEASRASFFAAYGRSPDPDRLRFVSLLQYANVALWRMCSFFRRGENQSIRDKFLRELADEIQWIRDVLA